jgi:SagB-type dehydrogenase family enzyme
MMSHKPTFAQGEIALPHPIKESSLSLEEVLNIRRSVREFSTETLSLEAVSNLLWAAYGNNKFKKTVPSAGALYPLSIYLVVSRVEKLNKGIYLYQGTEHSLKKVSDRDITDDLSRAAFSQTFVGSSPLILIISAQPQVTTAKYGQRGIRYIYMEAGHVSQNIYLQATRLGLGTVAVGAFYDQDLKDLLQQPADPLYIMPVGKPK